MYGYVKPTVPEMRQAIAMRYIGSLYLNTLTKLDYFLNYSR
jgi:hypothetical protein